MSFAESVARQQDAVFRTLGEDADWEGVGTVRVRRREADEELRFDRGAIVETGRTIRVRKSEVPSPTQGQVVQILDAAGDPVADATFVVTGEPMLDRKGVWTCPVQVSA